LLLGSLQLTFKSPTNTKYMEYHHISKSKGKGKGKGKIFFVM